MLCADTVVHRTTPFREPGLGRAGVRRYLTDNFLAEADIECWFGPELGYVKTLVDLPKR